MDHETAQAFMKGLGEARRARRPGLNTDDIAAAVKLIREGVAWTEIKAQLPVEDQALEAWRPELERRAALPPGREREQFEAPVWTGQRPGR